MLSTQPFRILLLLISFLLAKNSSTQPLIGSLEYKYSTTKYGRSRGSKSNQLLGGLAKELADGLRVGVKAGVTIDKIYSAFYRNKPFYSVNNVLAYAGINVQKRLLADTKKIVSLWVITELAVEPFIKRNSIFLYYYGADTITDNTSVSYNGVYINKTTRFTLTPSLKTEIKINRSITVVGQAGYAVDLGKSNQISSYFTNVYTLTNFPELTAANPFKENYLFAGAGVNFTFK